MKKAFCRTDNQVWSVDDFSKLSAFDLVHKRRNLYCTGCDAPAYYKSAAKNGSQAACFGARQHQSDCLHTSIVGSKTESGEESGNQKGQGADVILSLKGERTLSETKHKAEVVDIKSAINFGLATSVPTCKQTSRLGMSNVLNRLIEAEGEGCPIRTFRIGDENYLGEDFFVPFDQIKEEHIGKLHGFWGIIDSVRVQRHQSDVTWWLNTEDFDGVSFRLTDEDKDSLCRAFSLERLGGLKGKVVLAITHLHKSTMSEKLFIKEIKPEFFAIQH